MALEATHIQFAYDLRDKYKPQDLNEYFSGTIYPDSRYVTGLDRTLTHFDNLFEIDEHEQSDFKKGWAAHMLCDKVMRAVTEELFGDILSDEWLEGWMQKTAVKILVEYSKYNKELIFAHRELFDHIENPNNESIEKIVEYNQIVKGYILDKENITKQECIQLWQGLGISNKELDGVLKYVDLYESDNAIMEKIDSIYQLMLEKAKMYE